MTANQWLTVLGLIAFLALICAIGVAYQLWITRLIAGRFLKRQTLEQLDSASEAGVRRFAGRWVWLLKVTHMRRLEELLQSRAIEPTEGADLKKE